MTHRCAPVRRRLLAEGPAAVADGLAACRDCRRFAARLAIADDALADAAAAPQPLSGALRARILAATAGEQRSLPPRGRLLDLVTRLAAAAAVVVAATQFAPGSAVAAEGPSDASARSEPFVLDVGEFRTLSARFGASLPGPAQRVAAIASPPERADDLLLPVGAAAGLFLALGLFLRRR